MKRFVIFLFVGTIFTQVSFAEDCFMIKPGQKLNADSCGPIGGLVSIKDCATGVILKTLSATLGVDCLGSPVKIKLLYNDQMLVGELTQDGDSSDLIISKTYFEDRSREPAQSKPRVERNYTCFTMRPIEAINPRTCEPVRAQIQFLDCGSHKPFGGRLEVTTHYSCNQSNPELKYWYKKMMLVGSLKKTPHGLKVAKTYALIYPSIYGVYNDRQTSSVGGDHQ